MRWILRFIGGFLKINLSGEYAEILINKASKNGVVLWGMYPKNNNIIGFVALRDFKYLLKLRKQARAKIKINKRIGLPFVLHRYRKRAGILLGAVFFLVVLNFLSLFIWTIEVSGNSVVTDKEIIAACKSAGLYEGVKASEINSKNSADKILLKLDSLAWCSVNIEGCLVTVNVTETKNLADKNKNLPSNIVAKEDGIIKKIDVVSGDTVVSVGDVVAKGDLLVSGIYENMSSTVFRESKGSIKAEIEKTFTAQAKFSVTESIPYGKIINHTEFNAFGIKIPLYFLKVKGDYIEEKSYKRIKVANKKLPFSITKHKYILTNESTVVRNEETIKELLLKDVKKQIKKYGDKNYKIKDEKYIKTKEGITLEQTVVLLCDIAEQKSVIIADKK